LTITTDNFAVYIAAACAALAVPAWIVQAVSRREDGVAGRIGRAAYRGAFGALGFASAYLMLQILSLARYDIAYIHNHSSPRDDIIYRVSSFWAGQEGSMLLWTLIAAGMGLGLAGLRSGRAIAMAFWSSVVAMMTVLLVIADPFAGLEGFQPGMVGVGLNPLLKNAWMAIHPPIIFVGYAALMVPAAFAVRALLRGDVENWTASCLPWVLFGWVSLTAGIALGMVWSYEVLGWGGYWGWDPVENASLIPWITATALVHGLLIERRASRFTRANLFLALLTFLLILHATFLTRSGVLADISVHSFSDLGAYGYLLGAAIAYLIVSLTCLVLGWRKAGARAGSAGNISGGSREFALALGVGALLLFALMVFVGTNYPLVSKVSVMPRFFTRMSVPLALLAGVFILLAQSSGWGTSKPGAAARLLKALVVIAVISGGGGLAVLIAPARFGAAFAWLTSAENAGLNMAVQSLLLLFGIALALLVTSASLAASSRLRRSGAHIAHAGVALMLIGIVLSSAGRSVTLSLARGARPEKAPGVGISYVGARVDRPGEESILLNVFHGERKREARMKIESTGRGAVKSPYIASGLGGDLYISPVEAQSATVTPLASMTDDGWLALPAMIPGTRDSVRLLGMTVESRSARLEYVSAVRGRRPVEFSVSEGAPARVGGLSFEFRRFVSNGSANMADLTAGVELSVSGRGLAERLVVEVSRKPMIWMLWLGLALVVLGGILAWNRRRVES